MTTVVAFDPGKITGVAVGQFYEDTALELSNCYTVTYDHMPDYLDDFSSSSVNHVVIEEFILRDNDFRADLLGVRVEGMLAYVKHNSKVPIVWRPPSKKSQVPDQVLKDHGLWQTGKDVDWEDGRDANDAIIHLLGYVAFDLKHRPTLERYFK